MVEAVSSVIGSDGDESAVDGGRGAEVGGVVIAPAEEREDRL